MHSLPRRLRRRPQPPRIEPRAFTHIQRGAFKMVSKRIMLLGAAMALTMGAQPAFAKQWQVKMVNKGTAGFMTFEPAFLKVNPGDTVKFIATDKGHNVESIADMVPAGAAPFKGKINEEIAVTFKNPGLYGYKCLPHAGMGMVGLIEVRSTPNRANAATAASKLPGLAKGRMTALIAQAK
jgi:pseudoazurin